MGKPSTCENGRNRGVAKQPFIKRANVSRHHQESIPISQQRRPNSDLRAMKVYVDTEKNIIPVSTTMQLVSGSFGLVTKSVAR